VSAPPKKPGFGDMSRVRPDPALRALVGLRPRGATPNPAGAQTYVGRLAEEANRSLEERIRALKAEREGGMVLLRLDPKQIAVTDFANRDRASLDPSDPKLQELIGSLRTNGQDTPVRLRPAAEGAALPYELVEGHRRLAACLLLDGQTEGGFQILARLDAAARDTRDLALKMYRENEERFDLSAIEKGRMFRKWLDAGLYGTAREIAEAVATSEQNVGKYLGLADLPEALLEAFTDVREIPVRAVSPLSQAVKQNPDAVLAEAARLSRVTPRAAADAVIRQLIAAGATEKPKRRTGNSREESVRIAGRIPLKVAQGRNRIHLKLQHLDAAQQKQFANELKDWAEAWLRQRLEPQ
jgi:ParB family chromosome partitioning protein